MKMKTRSKTELHKRFCENVRAILKERSMTQKNLADLSGMKYSCVSRILSGACVPSLPSAERIASALNVDCATLFAKKEN